MLLAPRFPCLFVIKLFIYVAHLHVLLVIYTRKCKLFTDHLLSFHLFVTQNYCMTTEDLYSDIIHGSYGQCFIYFWNLAEEVNELILEKYTL